MIEKCRMVATGSNLGWWTLIVISRFEILFGTDKRKKSRSMSSREWSRWLLMWGFRWVNQRSSNNQWVNSLVDMFLGLFLSSVPDRISNLDITNYCAPTEIRTRGSLHTFHYHYRWATGTHWYLWELPDQLTNPYHYYLSLLLR